MDIFKVRTLYCYCYTDKENNVCVCVFLNTWEKTSEPANSNRDESYNIKSWIILSVFHHSAFSQSYEFFHLLKNKIRILIHLFIVTFNVGEYKFVVLPRNHEVEIPESWRYSFKIPQVLFLFECLYVEKPAHKRSWNLKPGKCKTHVNSFTK